MLSVNVELSTVGNMIGTTVIQLPKLSSIELDSIIHINNFMTLKGKFGQNENVDNFRTFDNINRYGVTPFAYISWVIF